jgi:hypothetical protein
MRKKRVLDSGLDRKIKVLFIFTDHPGGLKLMELWEEVKKQDICARPTLRKVLDELTAPPSPLIEKDQFGKYTLGLGEPISQIIREGSSQVADQIDKFLEILYKTCNPSDKAQIELYNKLGTLFLQSKISKTVLTTSILVPFFYDSRIRELWLYSQKFVFDIVYQKMDEMSEKLLGIKMSRELEIRPEMDELVSSKLKEISKQLALVDNQILDLICQLNIADNLKISLIHLISSKPLTQAILKEQKSIARIIRALKEGKEPGS